MEKITEILLDKKLADFGDDQLEMVDWGTIDYPANMATKYWISFEPSMEDYKTPTIIKFLQKATDFFQTLGIEISLQQIDYDHTFIFTFIVWRDMHEHVQVFHDTPYCSHNCNTFKITLACSNASETFYIPAEHEQCAIDILIDYLEENEDEQGCGWLEDEECCYNDERIIEFQENGQISGGNHNRFLSTHNVYIEAI